MRFCWLAFVPHSNGSNRSKRKEQKNFYMTEMKHKIKLLVPGLNIKTVNKICSTEMSSVTNRLMEMVLKVR